MQTLAELVVNLFVSHDALMSGSYVLLKFVAIISWLCSFIVHYIGLKYDSKMLVIFFATCAVFVLRSAVRIKPATKKIGIYSI